MNIITILKQVPDLVEELELNSEGNGLNKEWMKFILSEYDDHALEQSLLLKEKNGGSVKAIGLDIGGIEESLVTASAKGADELIVLKGGLAEDVNNHTTAKIFQSVLSKEQFDLILLGVQAIDDRDGSLGPILAGYMNLPYVGVVRGVTLTEDKKSAVVGKEYPGGVIAEFKVTLPAILGIQAAEKPPRYVPIAKIRQAQKSAKIKEVDVKDIVNSALKDTVQMAINITKMFKPESTGKAEIIDGDVEKVAESLVSLFTEKSIVR